MAAGAGVWRRGLNDLGLTPCPGCAALTELLLFANKIKELTPKLGSLSKLETFNVFNNQVKKLPEGLGLIASLEEVNAAANKLMMLSDKHFAQWSSVKVLSLYDNNLVRCGSMAPLVALERTGECRGRWSLWRCCRAGALCSSGRRDAERRRLPIIIITVVTRCG